MSFSPRGIAVVLGSLLALGAGAQIPPGGGGKPTQARPVTTYDVISKMPWDPAKEGPLVAVVALRMTAGKTLDDLGRTKATVGGLTAIVPKTMVTVNSRLTAAPNMYEGLPQEAKVMYLLRTLTPGQWSRATGSGLTLADLQGEQVAVFDSILPNPLRYSMGTIMDGDSITNPSEPKDIRSLQGAERAKVKLRIVRHLEVQVALANDGGYTGTTIEDDLKKGMTMPFILKDDEGGFGQKILVRGPNVPRKSHLDLRDARFDKVIPFVPGELVKALLQRMTAATGVRFVADAHYANMMMVECGTSAATRDLLGALSLGVAGTYRRVGDTYVLTNDLEGMAAHRARIAVWEDALNKEVDARMTQWRNDVAKGGGFGKIAFHSPTYDGLTPAEQANLEANDKPNNGPSYIPIGQASKPLQQAIKDWRFGNQIDREKVGVSSSIRYEIVLPEGGRGWWRGWLGNTDQFMEKPYVWAPPNPAPVTLPLETKGSVAGLVLRANTPAEARRLVTRVDKLGMSELWLETRDAATLKAAVEAGAGAGVKVSLALRPWEIGPNERSADPDRTSTGDHGPSLVVQKAAIVPWQKFWQDVSAFEPPTREFVAPLDPSTNARIASAAALAATKGLAKVVVLDLYPTGYGKAESNASGGYWYSNAVDSFLAYGYTDALRAAFLSVESLDPIDLESQMVRTDVNLSPAWFESFSFGEGFAKWQTAKGKWSHERAVALTRALHAVDPARPLLMPGEPPKNHLPPLARTYLFRWRGPEGVPLGFEDYGGGQMSETTDAQLLELQDDRDPAQRNRVANRLKKLLAKPTKPLVLDLSSVPQARLEAVIVRWLKDK